MRPTPFVALTSLASILTFARPAAAQPDTARADTESGLVSAVAAASDPGLARLRAELERLTPLAGGRVGVAAIHLESGREVFLDPDEPFPMASTYKVPIAVTLLDRVSRGEVDLAEMVELRPGDLHPGSGTLTELFDDPGVILSLRNLLELMLLISDNSATDLVLARAGGGEAVSEQMHRLGLDGIRVDRSTLRLIGDWVGIDGLPTDGEISMEAFGALASSVSEAQRMAAAEAFDADPRDTATPRAMGHLLAGLWRGELLDRERTDLLLDIMRRCDTGEGRIRGLLPPGSDVAHKTGTIGGTTNDVGIVTLPADAGHVVTVIFVKESKLEVEERERAIAHLARAVYDYFLFDPD